MKPVDDVRQILALAFGFIASKALSAALDRDLFTKIAGGATILADLATATGIASNRLRTLLTGLKTIGLVSESDGTFVNAPAVATYLLPARRATSATASKSPTAASFTKACAILGSRCAARGSSPIRAFTRASPISRAVSAARPSAAPSMPDRSARPV
jgi:hypothetical protein